MLSKGLSRVFSSTTIQKHPFQNHPPTQSSHDTTRTEMITEALQPGPAARDRSFPGPPGATSRQTWESPRVRQPSLLHGKTGSLWQPQARNGREGKPSLEGGPGKEEETPGRTVRQEGGLSTLKGCDSMTGKTGPGGSLPDTSLALPLSLAEQVT